MTAGSYVVPAVLRYRYWALAILVLGIGTLIVVREAVRLGWPPYSRMMLSVIAIFLGALAIQAWRRGPCLVVRVDWDEKGVTLHPLRGHSLVVPWPHLKSAIVPLREGTQEIAYGFWITLSMESDRASYFVPMARTSNLEALIRTLKAKTMTCVGRAMVGGSAHQGSENGRGEE